MSATSDESTTGLRLDAGSLRVLAHPLRSRLLGALRRDGPATATDLAAALGTNSGATSYHLRKLEAVGLVADTGKGEGRRRLWRAATRSHSWRVSDVFMLATPEQVEAFTVELGSLVERYRRVGEGHPDARRLALYTALFPMDLDQIPERPER